MNKILNWLFTNMDKVCHFCVCVVISIVYGAVILHTTAGVTALVGATCGLLFALFIGLLKEVYDCFFCGGKFDVMDLLADVIGGLIGAILFILLFV